MKRLKTRVGFVLIWAAILYGFYSQNVFMVTGPFLDVAVIYWGAIFIPVSGGLFFLAGTERRSTKKKVETDATDAAMDDELTGKVPLSIGGGASTERPKQPAPAQAPQLTSELGLHKVIIHKLEHGTAEVTLKNLVVTKTETTGYEIEDGA